MVSHLAEMIKNRQIHIKIINVDHHDKGMLALLDRIDAHCYARQYEMKLALN